MTAGTLVARGRPRSARADQAITDATLGLLAQCGYGELTMAGVAARAGVSTATLYRRFASKPELVIAAVATLIETPPPVDTGSLAGDLRVVLGRLAARMTDERRDLFLSLAAEIRRHPQLGEVARERLLSPLRLQVEQVLAGAVVRGDIAPVPDPDIIVSLLCGPLYYRILVTGEPVDERVVEGIVQFLCAAMGAR